MNSERLATLETVSGGVRRLALCSACVAVLLALEGCSANVKPVVGQIMSFTTASGATQTTVTVLHPPGTGTPSSIYLDAAVASDPEALGVDWTVTCSSSQPEGSLPAGQVDTSCGSFSFNHTTSGPVPTYTLPQGVTIVTQYTAPQKAVGSVTITAHATSLPSSTSSLTLTIM